MAAIKSAVTYLCRGDECACSNCGRSMVWGDSGIVWQLCGRVGSRLVLCHLCIPKVLGGMCRDYQTLLENDEFIEIAHDHNNYLSNFAKSFIAIAAKAEDLRLLIKSCV